MIHVVAGALFDARGRVLIAQRPASKHLAGQWEFPGGKLAEGEAPYDGLVRELREELGIEVIDAQALIAYPYEYPGKRVYLDLWHVTRYTGTAQSLDGQALRWVELEALREVPLVEADAPMVSALMKLRREAVRDG